MLQPLNPEQVQPTVQNLLAFLDREDVNIPGNMVESIVSGKSLLRALLGGQLVLAQNVQEGEPGKPEPKKPVAAKKTAKKVVKKAA